MKKSKAMVSLILISTFSISIFSGCSSTKQTLSVNDSKPIEFKLGLVDSEKSNYYKGMKKLADEVDIATEGEIKIKIYPSSQLGNERDMYEGALLGTVDICSTANSVMSAFIPEMAILDQPFLFDSVEQANKVIDGKFGDKIAKKTAVQGIHTLGWMESGFRNIFTTNPIEKPEDFKGLKIRTMENSMHIETFNSLGAIATPMAAGDIFTALQQKTIDGAENATCNVLANKYYEVTKNITRSEHFFTLIGINMSDNAWNKIPDDLKDKFTAAVKRGCIAQRQYLEDANKEAEEQLVADGVRFYNIDKTALKEAVAPSMEKYKSKIPKEWLDLLEESKK